MIQKVAQTGGDRDEKLRANVVQALLGFFQDSTQEFREVQTGYLKQLQKRESEYNQYFAGSSSAFSAEGKNLKIFLIFLPKIQKISKIRFSDQNFEIFWLKNLKMLEKFFLPFQVF